MKIIAIFSTWWAPRGWTCFCRFNNNFQEIDAVTSQEKIKEREKNENCLTFLGEKEKGKTKRRKKGSFLAFWLEEKKEKSHLYNKHTH